MEIGNVIEILFNVADIAPYHTAPQGSKIESSCSFKFCDYFNFV
ncbi:hypothetical protein [Clostridium argentinense]|nr:hypothetical protein [Clostridium argentinense]